MKKGALKQWLALISLLLLILSACAGASTALESTTAVPATAIPAASTATAPRPTATYPPLDPTYAAQIAAMRHPDVPDLPFADNPDPALCGIPVKWGLDEPAYLTGLYEGELAQPVVLLYDSHSRFNIVAQAPHGTQVEVILYQQNPVIDYYLVKAVGQPEPNEGWVPAPFLSFDPVITPAG